MNNKESASPVLYVETIIEKGKNESSIVEELKSKYLFDS